MKASLAQPSLLPDNFVYLADIEPAIHQDVRYATDHNFIGNPLPGYIKPIIVMTVRAAEALKKVQADLAPFHLGLKVYDAYRPQKCVDEFVRWSKDLNDQRMKSEFYPYIDKSQLFEDGYIGSPSTHTRGSTVDLTIIPLPAPPQPQWQSGDPIIDGALPQTQRSGDNSIDMGTAFDYFGGPGHTFFPELPPEVRANRNLLRILMEKHGFRGIKVEWWHFVLKDEPFPDTYFDFNIE